MKKKIKNKENIVIFSTESSAYFAKKVAQRLGIPNNIGFIDRKTFGDGEKYYRIGIDDRQELIGKSVIFVGSTHKDEDFDELYRIGCAAAGYGALQRIFLIPFFGYSTMERAVKPGEVVTAKTCARILSSIPNTRLGNTFFMFDLHVAGLVHYFEGDCLRFELHGGPELVKGIKKQKPRNFKFGSADLGRPIWVKYFADQFGVPELVFVHKTRVFDQTEVMFCVGEVDGYNIITYDDMSRSFGTLIEATETELEQGALSVSSALSHLALYSEEVIRKIIASPLKWVVHTNSHPMSQHPLVKKSNKFIEVDVTGVFANAIMPLLINA